jgi:hypothetical protein
VVRVSQPLSVSLLGLVLAALPVGSPLADPACRVLHAPLQPEGRDHGRYATEVAGWRLEIRNASAPRPAPSFNDDPLEVQDVGGRSACKIEGGVWEAGTFAILPGPRRLLAVESSGSTVDIALYDLTTCQPVRRLPVREGVVGFENGLVKQGGDCRGRTLATCRETLTVSASRLCH